ncbi:hypothetical protein DMNBHIDG_02623 [Candidatus Methanoperedenaceae archaeon GB37]|nr:hypothetical protein DMNBHIDG_02623 [Candidatus Methanoperedenaceae archaeon GB37]
MEKEKQKDSLSDVRRERSGGMNPVLVGVGKNINIVVEEMPDISVPGFLVNTTSARYQSP